MENSNSANAPAQKRQWVQDEFGGVYELKRKLAEGGQGIVLHTNVDNLLVKVCRWPQNDPRSQMWSKQIEALQRLPVAGEGLPVVMPKARITKPRLGYVMEMVDGLIPLEALLSQSLDALAQGAGLEGYVTSGGLGRRLRLLARLARVLARVHGLALAHGDISPKNVFVSRTHEHSEVWLIDCDNLTYAVRDSSLSLYTPDYGAPEILRGDAGISTYTDIWSFAVIAFQLLTQLHPFKSGALVDADAELEQSALRGELPWVDHPTDARNRAGDWGIDRSYVLTPELAALFERCFHAGALDAVKRPFMSEWAEALEAAAAQQVLCAPPQGCESTFLWNTRMACPFCGTQHPQNAALRLKHAVYVPKELMEESSGSPNPWIETPACLVAGQLKVELRSAPPGSAAYLQSPVVATIEVRDGELLIAPANHAHLHLQVRGTAALRRIGRAERLQVSRRIYALHIGSPSASHDTWRFVW